MVDPVPRAHHSREWKPFPEKRTARRTGGSLAVVEKHLSLGISRKFSDKVTGSLSYVHAFSNSVKSNVAPYNTIELEQNLVNMQISYQF